MFKKYRWNIVIVTLLVSLVGFAIFDAILYRSIRNYLFEETFREMEMKTRLAVMLFEKRQEKLRTKNLSELYNITYQIRGIVNSRVTIIDSSGRVLTDSDVARDSVRFMDNHINRPEIRQAIAGGWGQSYRKSETVNRRLFYTAFPIKQGERIVGFLRLAYYSQNFERSMKEIVSLILAANFIGLFILFGLALVSGSVVTRPILKIVDTARRISEGDLERNFTIRRRDEIGALSDILNQLTERLKNQITQISNEHLKLREILSNLNVGIIVIDSQKKVLHTNPELAKILDADSVSDADAGIHRVIRYPELANAVENALGRSEKTAGEFVLYDSAGKKYIRYLVTPFQFGEEEIGGALIQLHDITELKRLEAVRRDFVANASHELKTPLTSIIGYTETLQGGEAVPLHLRERFIRRIGEQARRLELLINDLLKLSELEREQPLELVPVRPASLLEELAEEFAEQAEKKKINLTMNCPGELRVKADPRALLTVLSNLIDNALKYTPDGGSVTVSVTETENGRVRVEVADTGIGILPKYHERIFQRFYRLDKARSREMGGTGLGLAIVKHVVEKHNSRIHLESEVGQGSRFWFELEKVQE